MFFCFSVVLFFFFSDSFGPLLQPPLPKHQALQEKKHKQGLEGLAGRHAGDGEGAPEGEAEGDGRDGDAVVGVVGRRREARLEQLALNCSLRQAEAGQIREELKGGSIDSVLGDRERARGTYREFVAFVRQSLLARGAAKAVAQAEGARLVEGHAGLRKGLSRHFSRNSLSSGRSASASQTRTRHPPSLTRPSRRSTRLLARTWSEIASPTG